MKHTFFDAEISNIINETQTIKRFFVRVNQQADFHFTAGQFVVIDLPIESKITYRSYSIASAPNNTNEIELLIELNPFGKATTFLWNNIVIGDKIKVAGPMGNFCLPKELDREICFVGTGTGIAPLRSMLFDLFNYQKVKVPVKMIFGTRTLNDLLYKQELSQLQNELANFKYIPTLSRETKETWDGKIGYVHEIYEQLYTDKRPCYFYLCGSNAMIKEAHERIIALGYTKDDIKCEAFY